ncbi:MAG: hypothetical protein GY703_17225 [Gammaproteobacteria bacterium]|nr:hypothetical protein [Gammaproteobacteria bacterium]
MPIKSERVQFVRKGITGPSAGRVQRVIDHLNKPQPGFVDGVTDSGGSMLESTPLSLARVVCLLCEDGDRGAALFDAGAGRGAMSMIASTRGIDSVAIEQNAYRVTKGQERLMQLRSLGLIDGDVSYICMDLLDVKRLDSLHRNVKYMSYFCNAQSVQSIIQVLFLAVSTPSVERIYLTNASFLYQLLRYPSYSSDPVTLNIRL